MATTIDHEGFDKPTRGEVYSMDPRMLDVDWTKNLSRGGVRPEVNDEFIAFARSLMPDKSKKGEISEDSSTGQLNPCIARNLPNRKPEIVVGFRRLAAGLWLIESGECPNFRLKVIIKSLNNEEAALANLDENIGRLELTPLELGHAIRVLTETYHIRMSVLTKRFGKSHGWLSAVKDLTTLPTDIQEGIATGLISASGGTELVKVDDETQRAVFDEVKSGGTRKVPAAEIVKKIQKRQEAAGTGGPVKFTHKQVVERLLAFFAGKTGDKEDAGGILLGGAFNTFIEDMLNGDKNMKQLSNSEKKVHKQWDSFFPAPARLEAVTQTNEAEPDVEPAVESEKKPKKTRVA